MLNEHTLRMAYAKMLSDANEALIGTCDGLIDENTEVAYGLASFISNSDTHVFVPFKDESLRFDVNPADYYGIPFLESRFYNPQGRDLATCMPTLRILYASEETSELREVFVDADTSYYIIKIANRNDMGLSEVVDTLFAVRNDERATGVLSSIDDDKAALDYINTIYSLVEAGYVFQDQDTVMRSKEDFERLHNDLDISIKAWMTRPEDAEDSIIGLPALFMEVMGRRVEIPMNADLFDHMQKYIVEEIKTL